MYQFKLQTLLNHHHRQEEVCQKELAEAQRELTDAQQKLKCLKKDKGENIQKLQTRQEGRHHISDVLIFINYIKQLSIYIRAHIQQVDNASENVTHKRNNLIAIMKKRKTLEKLKEKECLEYQKKMLQAERKFNDEVAANRHIRGM